MAKACGALTKRGTSDWRAYLKALTKLNSAQSRKHNLRRYGRQDGNPKRNTLTRATAKANAAIRAANSEATEAKRKFERTMGALKSCMAKG